MKSLELATLFTNAQVYCRSTPFASAALVQNGVITWIGDASGANVHSELAGTVIDCQGQFLAPAFVDAHVHATSTGLLLDGLNLTEVNNRHELLQLLSKYATLYRGGTIIGHGWDQSRWNDQQLPSRKEIDQATWGSVVYLSRVDVHSALVSSALIAQVPHARELDGYTEFAVSAQAHGSLRAHALGHLSASHRERSQIAFIEHALSRGIGSVHEMAGPSISSESDAKMLKERSDQNIGPRVFVYWGELNSAGGIETALALDAVGAGGDLFIDGAIGSRTAALKSDYTDAPGVDGILYVDPAQVASHVQDCVTAGVQAGFHVIGDRGMQVVLDGLTLAEKIVGVPALARGRHRLEHAELISEEQMRLIKHLNLTVSMQPLFDSLWGGPNGMYSSRLGDRATSMNRWGSLLQQGTAVCFSSDCPVTEVNPWAAIHASMFHHDTRERVTGRAAFSAHTRAGWRALGPEFDNHGVLEVGAAADLALWKADHFDVQVPDNRIAQWSTDSRSATVPLPHLGGVDTFMSPECLFTMVAGELRFVNTAFSGIQ